jgi:hypothetical protein
MEAAPRRPPLLRQRRFADLTLAGDDLDKAAWLGDAALENRALRAGVGRIDALIYSKY